jgi:Protein of unknown function (DUF2730).
MIFLQMISDYWHVLGGVITLIASCLMLYLSTKFVPRSMCRQCRSEITAEQARTAARLEDNTDQVRAVTALVQTLPTAQSISALELSIERLGGQLRELGATVSGHRDLMRRVEHQLDRVDTYLLQATPQTGRKAQ